VNNLCQLIHGPTHIKGNTLDLALVDENLLEELDITTQVLPRISDHNMVLLEASIPQTDHSSTQRTPIVKKKYNFKTLVYDC